MIPKPPLLIALSIVLCGTGSAASTKGASAVVKEYCYDCHDREMHKGELDLETLQAQDIASHSDIWEKVVRKMNARQMPPIGKPRPGREAPTKKRSPN